jgi:hypothetical protein
MTPAKAAIGGFALQTGFLKPVPMNDFMNEIQTLMAFARAPTWPLFNYWL